MSIHFEGRAVPARLRTALLAALFLAAGGACAGLPDAPSDAAITPTGSNPRQSANVPELPAMPAHVTATTTVPGSLAEMTATFDYSSAAHSLQVKYRVENKGSETLAVFDRGDRHAVMTRQLTAGVVPPPLFSDDKSGGLTLSHEALPLPHPAPTSPPTPLAARLAPGAGLEGMFSFTVPASIDATRIRWCLGIAHFNERDFSAGESLADVDLWRASFAVVDEQERLCTPWFDVARGAFSDAVD